MIREIAKNKYLYALALPGLLFLIVFAYVPMAGHLIAFKQYRLADGIWGAMGRVRQFQVLLHEQRLVQGHVQYDLP